MMSERELRTWVKLSRLSRVRRWSDQQSLFGAPATPEKLLYQFNKQFNQRNQNLFLVLITRFVFRVLSPRWVFKKGFVLWRRFYIRFLRALVFFLSHHLPVVLKAHIMRPFQARYARREEARVRQLRWQRLPDDPVKPDRKFLITLVNAPLSVASAERCLASAKRYGEDHDIEIVPAVDRFHSEEFFIRHNLTFDAAWEIRNNPEEDDPYALMGCFASHFQLWMRCLELDKPIIVLEHDALFHSSIPSLRFKHVIALNEPLPGYIRDYSLTSIDPGRPGGEVFYPWHRVTDTCAYALKPEGAKLLLERATQQTVPPVDHYMCKQYVDLLWWAHPLLIEHDRQYSSIAPEAGLKGYGRRTEFWQDYPQ